MSSQNFLDALAKDYPLIVKSQHHLQLKTTAGGMHNIYIDGKGALRFQPFGQQKTHAVSQAQLKKELASYTYETSDLAHMQRLSSLMREIAGKTGIFCDAGFSGGHAKVAIIRANKGDYDITVRQITVANSYQAEEWAIIRALEMYPGNEPIFSDCQQAVLVHQPRAQWIPRKQNREADHFGNMRK